MDGEEVRKTFAISYDENIYNDLMIDEDQYVYYALSVMRHGRYTCPWLNILDNKIRNPTKKFMDMFMDDYYYRLSSDGIETLVNILKRNYNIYRRKLPHLKYFGMLPEVEYENENIKDLKMNNRRGLFNFEDKYFDMMECGKIIEYLVREIIYQDSVDHFFPGKFIYSNITIEIINTGQFNQRRNICQYNESYERLLFYARLFKKMNDVSGIKNYDTREIGKLKCKYYENSNYIDKYYDREYIIGLSKEEKNEISQIYSNISETDAITGLELVAGGKSDHSTAVDIYITDQSDERNCDYEDKSKYKFSLQLKMLSKDKKYMLIDKVHNDADIVKSLSDVISIVTQKLIDSGVIMNSRAKSARSVL